MKSNISKFLAVVLAFGVMAFPVNAAIPRSPKKVQCTNYSTTIQTAVVGPGALYAVLLGTGASNEFLAVFDSATITGLTTSSSVAQIGPHWFEGNPAAAVSWSSNSLYNFDPPIEFLNGLMFGNSAATGQGCVEFEQGRGLSGN